MGALLGWTGKNVIKNKKKGINGQLDA